MKVAWKVGDPWTPERRIAQGKYYWKTGKKHSAYVQWGKAGVRIKKERGVFFEVFFDLRDEYES